MDIKLTEKQYRNLIYLSVIGNCVLGILGECHDDYKPQALECKKLGNYLIKYAEDFHSSDLNEDYSEKVEINSSFVKHIEDEFMLEHDHLVCFQILACEFSRRELKETITKEEEKQMKQEEFPPRLFDLWRKYEEHFRKKGFGDLVLIKKEEKIKEKKIKNRV